MREVIGIDSGGQDSGRTDSNRVPKMPGIQLSSEQPGYLLLPADKLQKLVCNEPIEKYYEVEDQPFARGKYATVKRCRHRHTGQQFAAKCLRKRRRSMELRSETLHEVAVLDACSFCPRVVRLHQVFNSENETILLLELAPGGELQMLLDKDEVPVESQVARLMRQILDGLIYLHSINVAHLDIKPQNLVLTGEFPDCDVKLCDFGISRYINEGADIREILGTPDYVAPEVLNYEPISLATDMWSVGVLIYVLLTGCSPFGGDTKQETFCNISQCKLDFPDELFEDISEDVKDLMRKLMVKEPSRRLTAKECLQHVWFAKYESVKTVPSSISSKCSTENNNGSSILLKSSEANGICAAVLQTIKPASNNSVTSNGLSSSCYNVPKLISTSDSGESREKRSGILSNRCEDDTNNNTTSKKNNRNNTSCVNKTESTSPEMKCLGSKHKFNASSMSRDTAPVSLSPKLSFTKATANDTSPVNTSFKLSLPKASAMDTTPVSSTYKSQARQSADKSSAYGAVCSSTPQKSSNTPKLLNKALSLSVPRLTSVGLTPVSSTCKSSISSHRYGLLSSKSNWNLSSDVSHSRFTEYHRTSEKDCVYKVTRCFITGSGDEELYSHPPRFADYCSNSESCESSSDNSSDSVSEMSIDSSSDRSSIISLDDSYDYRKYGYNSSYMDIWERMANLSRNHNQHASKRWEKECNGSFARGYTKLNSSLVSKYEAPFPKQRETINNNVRRYSVELDKVENGNSVVIREIKSGLFTKYNEVKCESVKSRIKRFQGAVS